MDGLSKLKNQQFYQDKLKLDAKFYQAQDMKQFEHQVITEMECDCNKWSICLYDFTFKSLAPDYFIFKPLSKPIHIKNYFDFDNLPATND